MDDGEDELASALVVRIKELGVVAEGIEAVGEGDLGAEDGLFADTEFDIAPVFDEAGGGGAERFGFGFWRRRCGACCCRGCRHGAQH